jgi:Xaa-Pro aminopeptidase
MKLHELGAQRLTDQAARVIENQTGKRIDFTAITPVQARGMLIKVQGLLREHRSRPNFHASQRDAAYLQLMVMEQALATRMQEQAMASAAATDPKAKAVMDKVQRGQALTPDEQQTVNKIALTKEGKKKPARMVREQSELQQAQVVLAAQDMIDRVQGMLEDVSEMQFKDLPALADSIKSDMGVEQSTQFQAAASAALTTLLAALQAGKTELESAQGVLTGQAPQVPGTASALPGAEPAAGEEDELDLSLDANLPGGEEEEEEEDISLDLGRERR